MRAIDPESGNPAVCIGETEAEAFLDEDIRNGSCASYWVMERAADGGLRQIGPTIDVEMPKQHGASADVTPPSPPDELRAALTSAGNLLSWLPSSDDESGVLAYLIYTANGLQPDAVLWVDDENDRIQKTDAHRLEWTDEVTDANKPYIMRAIDQALNLSEPTGREVPTPGKIREPVEPVTPEGTLGWLRVHLILNHASAGVNPTEPGPLPMRVYTMDGDDKDELLWEGIADTGAWHSHAGNNWGDPGTFGDLPAPSIPEPTEQDPYPEVSYCVEIDWPGYADTWWPVPWTSTTVFTVSQSDDVWIYDEETEEWVEDTEDFEVKAYYTLPLGVFGFRYPMDFPLPSYSGSTLCYVTVINTDTNEIVVNNLATYPSYWGYQGQYQGGLSGVTIPPVGNYSADLSFAQWADFWGTHAAGQRNRITFSLDMENTTYRPDVWLPNSFDCDIQGGAGAGHVGDVTLWFRDAHGGDGYVTPPNQGGTGWTQLMVKDFDYSVTGPFVCPDGQAPPGRRIFAFTMPVALQTAYFITTWVENGVQKAGSAAYAGLSGELHLTMGAGGL